MRTNIEIDDALLGRGDGGNRPQDQAQGGRGRPAAARPAQLSFEVVTIGGVEIALAAADHYRALRRLGIIMRKTIDLLIGTYCIAQDCALLHSDRDFDPMTQRLGLRAL